MKLTDKLSPHFTLKELNCKCSKCRNKIPPAQVVLNLVKTCVQAEKLRVLYGNKVMTVSSGYRCKEHNRTLGSDDTSQHVLGTAMDFTVEGFSSEKLYEVASKSNLFNGCGIYNDSEHFTHIDIRKSKARWDHRTK